MPSIPIPGAPQEEVFRVLVTGFGPFRDYSENPSWLAVQKLHNVILETESDPEPVILSSSPQRQRIFEPERSPPHVRPIRIHITALEVPVTYAAVHEIVPGLHARPPVLPPSKDPLVHSTRPPPEGYDLILHVGVGRAGGLRVERLAHKLGYDALDAKGQQCPCVDSYNANVEGKDGFERSAMEQMERSRLGSGGTAGGGEVRGFGAGYELFPSELRTDIDTGRLVDDLLPSGIQHLVESSDPGRYLCDFIYYCSLAEANRPRARGAKASKVLFVHCPPVGNPYYPEDVAEALKLIVEWVILKSVPECA